MVGSFDQIADKNVETAAFGHAGEFGTAGGLFVAEVDAEVFGDVGDDVDVVFAVC